MAKKKLFYETDAFLKLQSKWYGKLEKKGFIDIEKGELEINGDTLTHPQIFKTEKTQYDGGTQYFELCSEILREFKFRKDIHKMIFTKHSEGMSLREIRDWLANTHSISFSFKAIQLLIDRIKVEYVFGKSK